MKGPVFIGTLMIILTNVIVTAAPGHKNANNLIRRTTGNVDTYPEIDKEDKSYSTNKPPDNGIQNTRVQRRGNESRRTLQVIKKELDEAIAAGQNDLIDALVKESSLKELETEINKKRLLVTKARKAKAPNLPELEKDLKDARDRQKAIQNPERDEPPRTFGFVKEELKDAVTRKDSEKVLELSEELKRVANAAYNKALRAVNKPAEGADMDALKAELDEKKEMRNDGARFAANSLRQIATVSAEGKEKLEKDRKRMKDWAAGRRNKKQKMGEEGGEEDEEEGNSEDGEYDVDDV